MKVHVGRAQIYFLLALILSIWMPAIGLAAGTITGQVTDTSNQPIQGLWVEAQSEGCFRGEYLGGSVTNADGQYVININDVPAGGVYVRVNSNALNYVGVWHGGDIDCNSALPVLISDGQTINGIDFSLEQGGSISGTVTDISENRLAGIHIDVRSEPCHQGQNLGGAQTDASGNYTIYGVPPGEVFLWVVDNSPTNYAAQWYGGVIDCHQATGVSVTEGNSTTGIDMVLDQGGAISGRISDNTGPVANANVNASTGQNGQGACSDADGYYTIHGLPAGAYKVSTGGENWCGSEDYVPVYWDNQAYWHLADELDLNSGEIIQNIDFSVVLGGSVAGQITDASGQPLPGISVEIHSELCFQGNHLAGTTTGPDGSFIVQGVPEGDWILLAQDLSGGNYVREFWDEGSGAVNCEQARTIGVNAGQTTGSIQFDLAEGGSVSGFVRDEDGDPISGVHINARLSPCGGQGIGWSVTDEYGYYAISGLPPGSVYVDSCASCGGLGGYADQFYGAVDNDCNKAAPVDVTVGMTTENIDFWLAAGGSVSGHVFDENRQVITDAQVSIHANRTDFGYGRGIYVSQTDGSYTISGLLPGTYKVQANNNRDNEYVTLYYNGSYNWEGATEVVVTAGDDTPLQDIFLDPGGAITGKVTDSDDQPIAGLYVGVSSDACNWQDVGGTDTDADGNYTIRGLPAGNFFVGTCSACRGLNYVDQKFGASGSDCSQATAVSVAAGEIPPKVDFQLEPGGSISGRATDLSENGVANLSINAGTGQYGTGTCTDEDGNYVLTGLPAGSFKVSVSAVNWCGGPAYKEVFYDHKAYWDEADLIDLLPGDEITGIDFSGLERDTLIAGTILGDPAIGLANLVVVLHDSAARLIYQQSLNGNGQFQFNGLNASETYTLKVYDPFLNYQYTEIGNIVGTQGELTDLGDIELQPRVPDGIDPPSIHNPMAFILNRSDGTERLILATEIDDASGCQPASLKSVTATGPDGRFHYLYYLNYQALVAAGTAYGEYWQTTRENTFSDLNTQVGAFTLKVLDREGNLASSVVTMDEYTPGKLAVPQLNDPPDGNLLAAGIQVDPGNLELNWEAVPDAVVYQVRIEHLGERIWKSSLMTTTSVIIPEDVLKPGQWYFWHVMAFDAGHPSRIDYASVSDSLLFNTSGDVPPVPAPLSVRIVPWVAGSPLIPHDAYAGRQTTLKAVAAGGTPPYTYTWSFGDGSTSEAATDETGTALEAFHSYASVVDTAFSAQITVTDAAGASLSADYPIRFWAAPSRGVRINAAVDDALWWMHKSLKRFTTGGIDYARTWTGNNAGTTAAVLQAFLLNGHNPMGDPSNPYVEDTIRMREYILSQIHPVCIGPETVAGVTRNPDTNNNGTGLFVKNGHRLYETGLVLMALSTLGDSALAETIQDIVDYLAYAQVEPDAGGGRGGWRYDMNYRESDMSVTQFPLIGIEAAEHYFDPAAVSVPDYVKTELGDNFLFYVQNKDSGGFGYANPQSMVNMSKTGAGLAGMALTGIPFDHWRVTAAVNFIDRNWDTVDPINWAWNVGEFYTMYAVMKGMRFYESKGAVTSLIGNHDWYDEYSQWMIENQNTDGSWTAPDHSNGPFIDTSFGVLILLPQVFSIGPTAVGQTSTVETHVGVPVTFDHSASFHRDTERTLVAFAWDLKGDGSNVWETDGRFETYDFSYTEPGTYNVRLTVTDDNGNSDTDQIEIKALEAVGPVGVGIQIKPETLNLDSNGRVTAFVRVPKQTGYSIRDIDPDTLFLQGAPAVKVKKTRKKLIAKFRVGDLENVLIGNQVSFTLTGLFFDGSALEGSDMVRVIAKKKKYNIKKMVKGKMIGRIKNKIKGK